MGVTEVKEAPWESMKEWMTHGGSYRSEAWWCESFITVSSSSRLFESSREVKYRAKRQSKPSGRLDYLVGSQ